MPFPLISAEVQIHFVNLLFERAPLGFASISHNLFYIIQIYIIYSGCITVFNPFPGILVLYFQAFTANH